MQFISKLLQGSKNVVAFCSTVQKFPWLPILCYRPRLRVDFKIIISSIGNQEKENKILCIANEEMRATTFNSRQVKIWKEARQWLGPNKKMFKTRGVQIIKCVSNANFVQKRAVRVVSILKCFQSLYWVQFFEYSSYRESTVLVNFKISPQL